MRELQRGDGRCGLGAHVQRRPRGEPVGDARDGPCRGHRADGEERDKDDVGATRHAWEIVRKDGGLTPELWRDEGYGQAAVRCYAYAANFSSRKKPSFSCTPRSE